MSKGTARSDRLTMTSTTAITKATTKATSTATAATTATTAAALPCLFLLGCHMCRRGLGNVGDDHVAPSSSNIPVADMHAAPQVVHGSVHRLTKRRARDGYFLSVVRLTWRPRHRLTAAKLAALDR